MVHFYVLVTIHFKIYSSYNLWVSSFKSKILIFLQLRHAIQGHIDEQAERKNKYKAQKNSSTDYSDSEDELDDPQQLEVEHPKEPDGYRLVNRFSVKVNDENENLEQSSQV